MKNIYIVIISVLAIICLTSIAVFSFDFFHLLIEWIGTGVVISFFASYVLIVIFSVFIILFLNKHFVQKKMKVFFSIFFIFFIFTISFWKNPLYPQDFENNSTTISLSSDELKIYDNISQTRTTCFFLATCPFCEIASDYLNYLYISGQIKDIEIIYYAYPTTADSIVKSRGIKIPYKTIEDDSFFKFSGSSFPVIINRNNNSLEKWVGNDVNFACYDYLVSKQ